MKKTIFLLTFLILVPIVLGQNYTVTTGQLPTNITLNLELNGLTNNDTIELGSDDWITLEVNSFTIGENDTNYSFNPTLSIPLIEEGNYTKKIYYNATSYSNFEIPIDIEIRNDTDTYQNFLENQEKEYLDCIIRKMRENTETNNTTKRMKAEYECRYEVTNNPNGTIVIQTNTIIDEKPIIDNETKEKINTLETTTSGINTEITNVKTDMTTFKTDILNRIQNLEDNLTSQTTQSNPNSEINWTIIGLIVIIALFIFGGLGYTIYKKRQNQNEGLQPAERVSKGIPLPQKEETKKGLFKKKEPKQEFDRLI